jgi:hypothetical protein
MRPPAILSNPNSGLFTVFVGEPGPKYLEEEILGTTVFERLSSLKCTNMGDGVAGDLARRLMSFISHGPSVSAFKSHCTACDYKGDSERKNELEWTKRKNWKGDVLSMMKNI